MGFASDGPRDSPCLRPVPALHIHGTVDCRAMVDISGSISLYNCIDHLADAGLVDTTLLFAVPYAHFSSVVLSCVIAAAVVVIRNLGFIVHERHLRIMPQRPCYIKTAMGVVTPTVLHH